MKFIIGKKLEMSQIFDGKGNLVPVTLIEAGPCFVTQVKQKEKDGYSAVQIGCEELKPNKVGKSKKGKAFRYLKEFRIDESELKDYEAGKKIDVSVFTKGDKIKISGISKGKGFQGGVRRWGFSGRDRTHGVKHEHRTIGSVGSSGPERVFKGKKMPGRMGAERITVGNLKIAEIDSKNNIIAIKGAIPGRRGTLIEIKG